VAGSNIILDQHITRVYEAMNLVQSNHPSCKPFCESADGYARQEAVVVLILSSKTELQIQGASAYAEVIAQDCTTGSGASITTPSPQVQAALYQRVATAAAPRLAPDTTVRYVECHGTGTKSGDATEVLVLSQQVRSPEVALYAPGCGGLAIGSVKSNIGHTESASGLMGLLKAIISLHTGRLPPTLHYSVEHRSKQCEGLGDGTLHVVTEEEVIEHDAVLLSTRLALAVHISKPLSKGCLCGPLIAPQELR